MQVILLEKIDHLGTMGEEVRVKDGYARNFLLPQRKALRATETNRAYFNRERAALEASNAKKRDAAAQESKKLEKLMITIIRQAAESGQLYGSVSARDIAEGIAASTGLAMHRNHVILNTTFKVLGLFPVTVALHPEVRVEVTVNIARSVEEAEVQKKTGKALIKTEEDARAPKAQTEEPAEDMAADAATTEAA